MNDEKHFLKMAVDLAQKNIVNGGRPFGAVIVKNGEIIASGVNEITATNDPTAHAEMTAIRHASQKLAKSDLRGCAVYASGHPCPMCMAAMRMAGIDKVVYAYSNDDAEPFGLSTAAIYKELSRPFAAQTMDIRHMPVKDEMSFDLYQEWHDEQEGRR